MSWRLCIIITLIILNITDLFISYEKRLFQKKYKFYFHFPTKQDLLLNGILFIIFMYLFIYRFSLGVFPYDH